MDRNTILDSLKSLNDQLASRQVVGEVLLCGGAAMVLAFGSRAATKDVDAVFAPTDIMRSAIAAVASTKDLPADWLNDAAKGFFPETQPNIRTILSLPNLRVHCPQPEYILAMKCMSSRADSHDASDIAFLMSLTGLTDAAKVLDLVCEYYPHRTIPPKTQYLVEEIAQRLQVGHAIPDTHVSRPNDGGYGM